MNGKGVCAGGLCAVLASMLAVSVAASERPPGSADVAGSDAAPCTATSMRLPANIRIGVDFLPRIRQMLRRSPTFRAQCRRLAATPWVHVAVRLDPTLYDRHALRAATALQRPQPRLIVAIVSLQGLADPAMWVAHELEHVIEQAEDVDVARLARGRTAAWPSGVGMFETQRAIRAGETVLDEVNTYGRGANFVDD